MSKFITLVFSLASVFGCAADSYHRTDVFKVRDATCKLVMSNGWEVDDYYAISLHLPAKRLTKSAPSMIISVEAHIDPDRYAGPHYATQRIADAMGCEGELVSNGAPDHYAELPLYCQHTTVAHVRPPGVRRGLIRLEGYPAHVREAAKAIMLLCSR